MKIARVTPIAADKFLFVEVETTCGRVGLGEAGAWGHLEASAAALAKFGDYLIGRDPRHVEDHWQVMHRFGHFRGAAINAAISALDIACWDIKAQALDVPIFELLGGPVRTTARTYCHVKAATPDEMIAACRRQTAAGFTAIGHLNPFLDEDRSPPYHRAHARKLRDAIDLTYAIRETVGDDVDLCIELHRRLTPGEAIAFAREIADARPLFIEDPIAPNGPDAMARVDARVTVPVATGERFASLNDFQTLFARGAVSFARTSITLCGGLTGGRKIAALAEVMDIQIVPHNPLSPVCLAASLHFAAAIPNFAIQEYPTSEPGAQPSDPHLLRGEALVSVLPALADGYLTIPTAPGLGITLNHAVEPARVRKVHMRRHRDGSPIEQ